MLKNRSDIYKLIKEFDDLCSRENIWYSLAQETMLGAAKHGGFVPWIEKFSIMVDIEGFNKLERLVPKKIASSLTDKKYKMLTLSYVEDNSKWEDDQPFIEIMVLVPSTVKKVTSFRKTSTIIKNKIRSRANNIKIAINDLHEKTYFNGYLLVRSRKQDIKTTWIQALSNEKETLRLDFLGLKLPVIKEYVTVLTNFYGEGFMTNYEVPNSWKEYPAPLKEIGVQ